MGSSSRYKSSKGNKRKFFRGKVTINDGYTASNVTQNVVNKSASAEKLEISLESNDDTSSPLTAFDYNFIINSELFLSLITTIGRCPACIASINIKHLILEKRGLAQFFKISCIDCDWNLKFCSSKECNRASNAPGRSSYEVNKRVVIAFRENGQGNSPLKTFCRCINMPPPMTQTTFDDLNCDLHNAYVQTSQECL